MLGTSTYLECFTPSPPPTTTSVIIKTALKQKILGSSLCLTASKCDQERPIFKYKLIALDVTLCALRHKYIPIRVI